MFAAPANPEAELFRPLPKAPTATSLTVRKLIGKVLEGAIRVPEFQRPLRWTNADVLKLFDSLLRGYPIGALLFWRHPFEPGTVTVGSARVEVPKVDDGWYIVDGQQRTTALAATLLELSQGEDPRWELSFDPQKSRFLPARTSDLDPSRHVPLRALGDIRRLGRWLRDCRLSDKEQDRVEEVQQRLLDYEVPLYVMETEDDNALRGVFARLNSTGVRMRADEVFQALLGSKSSTTTRQRRWTDLEALQAAADVEGFGQPPRTEILRALLAMSGHDPSRRLEDLGDEAVAQLVSPEDAEDAVRRAVAFLQSPVDAAEPGCSIPAYAFVPYPVVFVLLAKWFLLFPEPEPSVRRTLAQWVWRGIATGVHQRAAVSAMRYQAREMRPNQPEASLRALLSSVGEPEATEWKLDPFHANHAASRVEMLVLLSLGPQTRLGSVSWRSLLTNGDRIAREVFPIPQLQESEREHGRTAANRLLLDARHTGLAAELRRWSWDRDRDALESHLIDQETFDALRANEKTVFFRRRGARLRAQVADFLHKRAGIGEPIVLPAHHYFDDAAVEKKG